MKIIVGLGNIGEKYLKTRHNVGFLALDYFLQKNEITPTWEEEKKLKAYTCKVPCSSEILLLAKPTTYMNLSGLAVSGILNFFKEPISSLIVIYDDIDLPLGKIRVRDKGSAGTHNGMRSIIKELGSEDFKRIRIGIESRGEISPKEQDISSFVLSDFLHEEYQKLEDSLKACTEELEKLIST